MNLGFVAQDQWGNTFFLGKHPRKELLAKMCRKHADKLYVDIKNENGRITTIHSGWKIGDSWFNVYRLEPL